MIPHTHCQLAAVLVCTVLLLVPSTTADETYECAVEKRDDESVCIFRHVSYTGNLTGITFKAPTGKIQHVAFEDSTLDHIPKELLSAFPHLRSLSVPNANLSSVTIPPNLERLYASNNQITQVIVQQTRDSTTLLELMLDSNRLHDVSNLTQFAKLEILNLSGNRELPIESVVELGRFQGLDRLRSLTLSDIGAKRFTNEQNVALPDLELLDLSNNNQYAGNVNVNVFAPLKSLQILRLAYMELNDLNVIELMENNVQLKMIYLEGNEFSCKELKLMQKHFNVTNVETPVTNPEARCPLGFKKENGFCCGKDKNFSYDVRAGPLNVFENMTTSTEQEASTAASTTASPTTVSGPVRSDDGNSAAVRLQLGNSWIFRLTLVVVLKVVLV